MLWRIQRPGRRVAGIASLALAVYALFLPHTPARKAVSESMDKLAWLINRRYIE